MTTLQPPPTQITWPFKPVHRGQVVAWFAPGSDRPTPAFVQRVNTDGTLCLTVLPDDSNPRATFLDQERQCVLHKEQPMTQSVERFRQYGTWDHCDAEKARIERDELLDKMITELHDDMVSLRNKHERLMAIESKH